MREQEAYVIPSSGVILLHRNGLKKRPHSPI